MKFEWDENKNNANIEKHGIDFQDAIIAFNHPMLKKIDERFEYGEKRWIALAWLLKFVVVIVFTVRNGVFRIISVRKANKKERKIYYGKFKDELGETGENDGGRD